jgi:hypothetical protein
MIFYSNIFCMCKNLPLHHSAQSRSQLSKISAPFLQGNLARSPPREGGTPLFLATATAANNSPRPSSAAKAVPPPPLVQAGQMPMPPTHPLTSARLLKPSSQQQQSSFEAVNPATQAKDDICRSASPNNSRPTSTGMSLARQATEKLKWKFLGW